MKTESQAVAGAPVGELPVERLLDEAIDILNGHKKDVAFTGRAREFLTNQRAARFAARSLPPQAAPTSGEGTNEDLLRWLASYLGCGGYNADTVDPKVFQAKILHGLADLEAQALERSAVICDVKYPTRGTRNESDLRQQLAAEIRAAKPDPLKAEARAARQAPAHTDHPARHWDRTCPACIGEYRAEWRDLEAQALAESAPQSGRAPQAAAPATSTADLKDWQDLQRRLGEADNASGTPQAWRYQGIAKDALSLIQAMLVRALPPIPEAAPHSWSEQWTACRFRQST